LDLIERAFRYWQYPWDLRQAPPEGAALGRVDGLG